MSSGSVALEREALVRNGMLELQFRRVQGLPAERVQRALRFCPELARARLVPGAVRHVAQQRVSDMRHVHAHLVGATGLQRQAQQARQRFCRTPWERSRARRSA